MNLDVDMQSLRFLGNSQLEIPSQLLGLWVWSGGRRLRLKVSAVGRQALGEIGLGARDPFPSGAVGVSVLVRQQHGLQGTTEIGWQF